jgi:transposase
MGGDHRSKLTRERDWLLARVRERNDLTLEQFRAELAERGVHVSASVIWYFFAKEKISFKKKPAAQRARAA